MSNFNRRSLRYEYRWTTIKENDNTKIIGFPEDKLLDINEGYEVLPFINKYMSSRKWAYESTFQNIEQTIREYLPENIRVHKAVKEWLDGNFRFFQLKDRDSSASSI